MSYQRTMDRQFSKDLDACSERVLGLAGRLLEFAKGKEGAGKKEKGKGRETLREEDVLDGYHNVVIDVMDQLFESVVCVSFSWGGLSWEILTMLRV